MMISPLELKTSSGSLGLTRPYEIIHFRALEKFAVQTLLAGAATLSQSIPDTLRITRAPKPPVLDDFVQSSPGMAITGFRQRNPDDGKAVTGETSAWLSYDDENFYAIFVCKNGSGQLRLRWSRRGDIFADDLARISHQDCGLDVAQALLCAVSTPCRYLSRNHSCM